MKTRIRHHWMLAAGAALGLSLAASAQSPASVVQSVESRRSHYADMAKQI